ncbi:hypothetical protein PDJAM_G00051530 [Pangasius djambal]|uniref:Uncharacterized protein n=1 Tax=Pangasius djambal TaxID=1691987 RepID=A0ACC5YWK4_9TELE|nr:hypothetical protein [Pangasius djambal]
MRQLKGKPKKESWKDKKERKQAMQEAREQVATVVLPTLAVLILLIVLFVYVATRPGAVQGRVCSPPSAGEGDEGTLKTVLEHDPCFHSSLKPHFNKL